VPAYLQTILYYTALIALLGGIIVGVGLALQARREAREGGDLLRTTEADMLTEFQRARDAGEMDDAEFRRVRDLLIHGRTSEDAEHRKAGPDSSLEGRPPASPPQEPPTSTVSGQSSTDPPRG